MAGALHVTGIAEIQAALEAMVARVEAATPFAVDTAAALLEGRARSQLSQSSHQQGTRTPSAPGSPPSLITGVLRSSFEILGPTPAGAAAWAAIVGPTAVYARIQELGGVTGRGSAVTLPARPYVRPAYDELVHSPELLDVFVQAWGGAIRGG